MNLGSRGRRKGVDMSNPWLDTTAAPVAASAPVQAGDESDVLRGVGQPIPGIPPVDQADRLRVVEVTSLERVCVVGTHGGAGESTLAAWLGGRAMERSWPSYPQGKPVVVLVARTTATGIESARRAARQWASGDVPVQLLGLVLIADAGGKLPTQIRHLIQHLSGGVPHTWTVPWVPRLRLEPEPSPSVPTGPSARVVRSIQQLITEKG